LLNSSRIYRFEQSCVYWKVTSNNIKRYAPSCGETTTAAKICEGLFKKGYDIPLCADMHFQPKVLLADALEKIRINPGNFADGRKDFEEKVYETEEDYAQDRNYLLEAMYPLVKKCKGLNRCMRIGTNVFPCSFLLR
jgi:4-hydroxy-3-methylbut-2-en-1-yl diphosphate synthase IspG/GcpE